MSPLAVRVHPAQVTVTRAEALLSTINEGPALGRARGASAAAGERARIVGAKATTTARRVARTDSSSAAPVVGRATRGVLVVAGMTLTVLATVLAGVGAIGWRVPFVLLALTVLALWWLRRSTLARSVAGRSRRPAGAARPEARRRPEPRQVAIDRRPGEPVKRADDSGLRRPPQPELFDIRAIEETEKQVTARAVAAEGWQPVPVPPPTYTMKAKAVYTVDDEEDDVASPYADAPAADDRPVALASG